MRKTQLLSFIAVIGCSGALLSTQVQSQVGAAKSTLLLQATTPGFSQSGNANLSGVLTAGAGIISNGTSGAAITANASGSGIAALFNGKSLLTGYTTVGPTLTSAIGAEKLTIGDVSSNWFEGMYSVTGPTGLPFYGYYAVGDRVAYHYLDTDNTWRLYYNGTYPMIADSSGNFGIGAIENGFKFTANNGRSKFDSTAATSSTVQIRNGGPNISYFARIGSENWVHGGNTSFDTLGMGAVASGATSRNFGVQAEAIGEPGTTNYGITAFASGGTAYAGYFTGNNHTTGTMSAVTKAFKIDHPLDPYNKYLMHSSVESDEMMNIYRGITRTDASGYATVEVPNWFTSLNDHIQYQLTVVDESDMDDFVMAKVVQKLEKNSFRIRTSVPNVEVNWMLTGLRIDKSATYRPIIVEQDKPDQFRGKLLDPLAYGKTIEAGEFQPLQKVKNQAGKVISGSKSPVQNLKVKK